MLSPYILSNTFLKAGSSSQMLCTQEQKKYVNLDPVNGFLWLCPVPPDCKSVRETKRLRYMLEQFWGQSALLLFTSFTPPYLLIKSNKDSIVTCLNLDSIFLRNSSTVKGSTWQLLLIKYFIDGCFFWTECKRKDLYQIFL